MPPEIDAAEAKQLVRQVEKIGGRDLGRLLQKAIDGETPFAAGTQVAKINDPTGGTPDAEARTAINAIIDALEEFGISASS